ncbi:ABC transporter permease [Lactobacillaceae bacterium L1_55_11]|nr:ABC transporter permease [Lactobacillaceae bacterium L1_55_11]
MTKQSTSNAKQSRWPYVTLVMIAVLSLGLVTYVGYQAYKIQRGTEQLKPINRANVYLAWDASNQEKSPQVVSDSSEDEQWHNFAAVLDRINETKTLKAETRVQTDQNGLIGVTPGYLATFDIQVAHGRDFNADDYQDSKAAMPVIVGADFASEHPLGQTFTDRDLLIDNAQYTRQYKVVGVLAKHAVLPQVYAGVQQAKVDKLDEQMILPLRDTELKENGNTMASMSYFDNLIVKTKDASQLTSLAKFVNQHPLYQTNVVDLPTSGSGQSAKKVNFQVQFESVPASIKYDYRQFWQSLTVLLIILVVLLILLAVNIWWLVVGHRRQKQANLA